MCNICENEMDSLARLRVAQLGGEGGSAVVETAWYWSTLWKDCHEDSAALVNCIDFGVLWTVKRTRPQDTRVPYFSGSSLSNVERVRVCVTSLHPGSQGPAGDGPMSRVTGHAPGSFRTGVHPRWWRPEEQTWHVGNGHRCPPAGL